MIIDFCQEAGWSDEDLVRIYGGSTPEFEALHSALLQLSRGEAGSIALQCLPGFTPIDGIQLTALVGPKSVGVRRAEGHNNFEVVLDRDGWRDAADQTVAFTKGLDEGHFNWLADFGEISLLLSVSGGW